jgi:phosphoadenosine phosphosulfate reductase
MQVLETRGSAAAHDLRAERMPVDEMRVDRMSVGETPDVADEVDTAFLAARYETASAEDRVRAALKDLFPGRIALVSSFGADSAVLLDMVARIDPATPVVFVDTGVLFPETLAYRDALVARLGLTAVTTYRPDAEEVAEQDPETFLWSTAPDQCCHIRKVLPLARALEGYDAWISGRKRFQAATRESLPVFETEGHRVKVNPLADWSAKDILAYMDTHDLPRHEMIKRNYLSIGCIPCTSPVKPGEDPRAGRWRGKAKVECGIHTSFPEAGAGI